MEILQDPVLLLHLKHQVLTLAKLQAVLSVAKMSQNSSLLLVC